MTRPNLPPLPNGVKTMHDDQAASCYGSWLLDVARLSGEAGIDYAIGDGWPGTKAQRLLMHESHIETARNEAIQLASWGL